ncbi:unnamed protein product [Arabidopsis arenosa]|uniref:Pectinesterase inhibitor domain-containing protein n=1 Tax=Arabidopsis arenosa TaxID=38785 RepID=A0A8S2A1I2_ARAAE|nr:unnamed protein product [Arabidopsis arenosa]
MPSIDDKAFCLQTLSAYPLAASATGLLPLAEVVIRGIDIPYAKLLVKSADRAAEKVPALKEQFKACRDAYFLIVMSLKSAASELKISPETANYDAMVCFDQTTLVQKLIGKNKDLTSKSLMEMTLRMDKLIRLAIGATESTSGTFQRSPRGITSSTSGYPSNQFRVPEPVASGVPGPVASGVPELSHLGVPDPSRLRYPSRSPRRLVILPRAKHTDRHQAASKPPEAKSSVTPKRKADDQEKANKTLALQIDEIASRGQTQNHAFPDSTATSPEGLTWPQPDETHVRDADRITPELQPEPILPDARIRMIPPSQTQWTRQTNRTIHKTSVPELELTLTNEPDLTDDEETEENIRWAEEIRKRRRAQQDPSLPSQGGSLI